MPKQKARCARRMAERRSREALRAGRLSLLAAGREGPQAQHGLAAKERARISSSALHAEATSRCTRSMHAWCAGGAGRRCPVEIDPEAGERLHFDGRRSKRAGMTMV